LRERFRELGRLLLGQHRSPGRVALALLCGFVVGCTPTFGVQILICIVLSTVLGLNLPIMYAAANISIPPMIPLIGFAAVQLGEWTAHGHFATLSRADFAAERLHATVTGFFWAWLRGGVILGSLLGLVIGGLAYLWLRRRAASLPPPTDAERALQQREQVLEQVIARSQQRFAAAHPRYRYYARYKYRLDPVYRALCEQVPVGAEVLDLGCGLGMLPIALAEAGRGRQICGLDWDAEKIAVGQQAAADLHKVSLRRADIHQSELPACEVVTLIDVLHYYEPAQQDALLLRIVAALRPGGLLLIRETDPARRGGAGLTRLIERAMVRLGWNLGPKVAYRSIGALRSFLESLGFTVEISELAATTHPGNVLLTCRKPSA
jgi:2-polyprenyl-3-methyl-5-hydroxy-6-metoxy-1,4-benzoquinol methylase/uncharacterized protein (DUF2062 family)